MTSSNVSRQTPQGVWSDRLRAAGQVAVIAGAVGSLGLTLYAGRRIESPVLLILLTVWVLAPFMALGLINRASQRWSALSQSALHGLMLFIALWSLAALAPRGPPNALVFIVVPAVSLLLIAIVLPLAAFASRMLSRESRVPHGALDRAFKLLAAFAVLSVIGLGALFGALWLEHRTETTLPTPTGPLAIGRAIYTWGDDATDSLAPVPSTKRELLVWIWYPTAAGQSHATMDDYVPAPMRVAAERARDPQSMLGSLMTLLTRDASKVHTHSIRNADLSPQQRSYPVVIMRGGASAEVRNYSTLAEDLASHGYVVVGFDAPYRTGLVVFPDGRVIGRTDGNNPELIFGSPDSTRRINKLLAAWTGDIAFVLDRLQRLNASDSSGKFTGRLDMSRVGVFGHSLGGATAAQFCHDDSRCKAGIDVDGAPFGSVVRDGIPRPFMFLLSDHSGSSDPASRQIQANIQSIYDRLPSDGRLRVAIRGANHFFFSDDVALLKSHIVMGLLRLFGVVDIEGPRQLAVTTHCVHTFFDMHLKGVGASQLSIASPLYPEIQILE